MMNGGMFNKGGKVLNLLILAQSISVGSSSHKCPANSSWLAYVKMMQTLITTVQSIIKLTFLASKIGLDEFSRSHILRSFSFPPVATRWDCSRMQQTSDPASISNCHNTNTILFIYHSVLLCCFWSNEHQGPQYSKFFRKEFLPNFRLTQKRIPLKLPKLRLRQTDINITLG